MESRLGVLIATRLFTAPLDGRLLCLTGLRVRTSIAETKCLYFPHITSILLDGFRCRPLHDGHGRARREPVQNPTFGG